MRLQHRVYLMLSFAAAQLAGTSHGKHQKTEQTQAFGATFHEPILRFADVPEFYGELGGHGRDIGAFRKLLWYSSVRRGTPIIGVQLRHTTVRRWRDMAPPLSQSEIQEITRLLEQGKALPDKYREILFVDRIQPAEAPSSPLQPPPNATAFVRFLLENPQIESLIREHENKVVPRNGYNRNQLSTLTTACVSAIGAVLPQILQHQPSGISGLISRWANRTVLPAESAKELNSIIHQRFRLRETEVVAEQRAQETREKVEAAQLLLSKYPDIVNTFCEIAERKVSVRDEYGDERMHRLDKEIDDCFVKIAGREGFTELKVRFELKKFGDTYNLPKEFARLRPLLRERFISHHAEQGGKKKTLEELAALSGVEFETAVAKLLSDAGWHVTATAATGDQGADLIASKGDRKVVVQAKRYTSPVGNNAVQEVVGAVPFYGGTEGCVVTNSTFTPAARALAQKNNIRLIDGLQFDKIADL